MVDSSPRATYQALNGARPAQQAIIEEASQPGSVQNVIVTGLTSKDEGTYLDALILQSDIRTGSPNSANDLKKLDTDEHITDPIQVADLQAQYDNLSDLDKQTLGTLVT